MFYKSHNYISQLVVENKCKYKSMLQLVSSEHSSSNGHCGWAVFYSPVQSWNSAWPDILSTTVSINQKLFTARSTVPKGQICQSPNSPKASVGQHTVLGQILNLICHQIGCRLKIHNRVCTTWDNCNTKSPSMLFGGGSHYFIKSDAWFLFTTVHALQSTSGWLRPEKRILCSE